VSGVERVVGKTFRWAGRYGYDLNQRTTLRTELNVFEQFRPVLPTAYAESPFLFLANIHPTLQLHVLEQARGARFVAMDTMNFWIEGTPTELRETLRRVDCLILNDSEARELAQTPNIVLAAQRITELGPRLVVVKRGEHGAFLYGGGHYFYAPAFPLENVVDPTGAGDSFAGGFMGYLAERSDTSWASLCQAVVAGSVLASFCVERFSIERFRDLRDDDIRARARAFRALTEFEPLPVRA
jgi:sugar/nucleoside kinase (ribokinase family)